MMKQQSSDIHNPDAARLTHADDATYRALERKRKIGLLERLMEKSK